GPNAPALPQPRARHEYPGAGSLIRLPLFGEVKMNQITFKNGVAVLPTKPNARLTRLRSWYHAHQRFPPQGHDYRSAAAMNLLKELDATRLEFRDEELFHHPWSDICG